MSTTSAEVVDDAEIPVPSVLGLEGADGLAVDLESEIDLAEHVLTAPIWFPA